MNRPAFDFSGKTVLVTGGTSGMGAATVEAFARSGARVVFAGRNEARAGSLLERIRQFSIEAHFVAGDVTDAAYCQHLVDETSCNEQQFHLHDSYCSIRFQWRGILFRVHRRQR